MVKFLLTVALARTMLDRVRLTVQRWGCAVVVVVFAMLIGAGVVRPLSVAAQMGWSPDVTPDRVPDRGRFRSEPASPPGEPGETAADETEEPFLTIGDPAPALDLTHWLKGRAFDAFESGTVYVIEFWATWCVPCRESMPLLTDLQVKYRDDRVRILGVSDERLQTVVRFLAQPEWYERIGYALATDPDRETHKAYMEAAAIGTIPATFVVGRDGRIEWIGHPRELAEPLEAIVRGTWDRGAARESFETAIAPERERFRRMRAMRAAFRAQDWPRLIEMFDEAIASAPGNDALKIQKFQLMVGVMDRPEAGYAYGETLLEAFWNEPKQLNQLAWYVVDYDRVRERDFGFAMKAAMRASELTSHADAAILDTVARVFHARGDLKRALLWQRRAVDHLRPDDPVADVVRRALAKYEEESARKRPEDDSPPR